MASMLEACRANQGLPAKLMAGPRTGYDLSRVGAGEGRGFNGKKKLTASPWSGTWPAPDATLDLDFANNRGFVRGVGQGGVMDAITFTRASTGTFVNEQGLLEDAVAGQPRFDWASTEVVARRNLLANTDSFASFSLGGVTRTFPASGETAPTGISAALFTETASSGFHESAGGWSTPGVNRRFTYSVYAKYNGAHLLLMFSGGTSPEWANFDLQNGQIGATSSGSNANIEAIGSGWYRVSVSPVLPTSGTLWLQLQNRPTSARNTTYLGDGVSGVYVGGVQFEEGTTATDYQANGAFVPSNTPLLPNPTCNGLLIEEARTNRLLWNRDATQTQWVKTDITAAKDQTGIDGVANAASSLTASSDGGTCIQTITLASGSRTGSVYLKRLVGSGTVQVSLDGTTWSTVDLSADEWRRIVLSGTVTNPVVGIKIAVSSDAVAMDYGQVEDGACATTPILTTTAMATRAADVANLTAPNTFATGSSPTSGTIFSTGNTPPLAAVPFGFGGTPRVYVQAPVFGGTFQFAVFNGLPANLGTSVVNTKVTNILPVFSIAGSFTRSDVLVSANGSSNEARSFQAVESIPLTFTIGRRSDNVSYMNSCVSRVAYIPKKITMEAASSITGGAT